MTKISKDKSRNQKNKMDKLRGTVKAKKKAPVKVKRVEVEESEVNSLEVFISDVIKKIVEVDVSAEVLENVMKNLQVDTSKDLTEDDLFLIYNLITEPLLKIVDEKYVYSNDTRDYENNLLKTSEKFMDVLPGQRLNVIYHHLPSLENQRTNFEIEKDIFRNKPLLGKGIFKCKKCGSEDTEDYEKQTRSADEPMTVFVHCRNCNAYFRFG